MRNNATYSTGPVYKATSDPLQEENARLKERVMELEEALRPFAFVDDMHSIHVYHDHPIGKAMANSITIGDCRKATALLDVAIGGG